uniref:Uncharacterized protein n=1 Tax=Anguilla anguilla TaxID=7936 RepID=A0A0E9WKW4_ANGAN
MAVWSQFQPLCRFPVEGVGEAFCVVLALPNGKGRNTKRGARILRFWFLVRVKNSQ